MCSTVLVAAARQRNVRRNGSRLHDRRTRPPSKTTRAVSSLNKSEQELQPPPKRASDPTPPWTRRLRRWIVPCVVAVFAIVGAWILLKQAGNQDGPGAPPTTASAKASPTSSPSGPTASTGPNAKSAADFEAIYTELQSTISRAYDQYRPELLDDVYAQECPATCGVMKEKTAIREMADAGERYRGYGPRILLVKVIEDSTGTILEGAPTRTVSIRLVDEQGPFAIVDRNGAEVARDGGWEPRSSVYRFYFSQSKRHWLIWKLEVEGSADSILGPSWSGSTGKAK